MLNVSNDVKCEVKALRDEGMEQHRSGKHADAAHTVSAAMRKLLMAPSNAGTGSHRSGGGKAV